MAWRNIVMFTLAFFIFTEDVHSNTQVVQNKDQATKESQNVTLKCSHTLKSYDLLIWYKHIPGLALEMCAYGYIQSTNMNLRYSMAIDKSSLTTELQIMGVTGEDTAVYYCAVSDGSGSYKLVFGQGTVLSVNPRTERTVPSVYQLKADKKETGLPETVCLVTDFPTPNATLTVDEKPIKLDDKSVLDQSTSDVWRYSAVVWDDENPSKDLSCKVRYHGKDVPQEKKIIDETDTTCSSLTINERFRTNPGMNTLSMSVFGMRMLTAKAVIFNLIITLRLWSS